MSIPALRNRSKVRGGGSLGRSLVVAGVVVLVALLIDSLMESITPGASDEAVGVSIATGDILFLFKSSDWKRKKERSKQSESTYLAAPHLRWISKRKAK